MRIQNFKSVKLGGSGDIDTDFDDEEEEENSLDNEEISYSDEIQELKDLKETLVSSQVEVQSYYDYDTNVLVMRK